MNIDILLTYWQEIGIKVNPGAEGPEIENLESKISFSFPKDFRDYLSRLNGFEDFEWDKDSISFWSIQRIENEIADHPHELLCFADYSINSHTFGFNRENRKIYMSYWGSDELEPLSESFTDFLAIYLNDRDKLLGYC